ncbi:OmpA family protein [Tsuneonella sp. YG55]|uniref:OmpA family protein n=1 Tax=Tsuneonella litorea TaxID=2976475 RepID=A0A9X2W0L3_9SPHN|nr:OmpA family protein [Tsuneonella litorea]MCT2557979.1 OmpA family protein [Tsuneonella litorea]
MRPNPMIALPFAFALVLSGCDRGGPDPAPAPSATATTAGSGEKVSIIRDDVGIDREPTAPLAPLEVVIGFAAGGTELTDAAVAQLRDALASEQMKAGGAITLGGHSDSAGSDTANLRASKKRAEAVRDWLVEHGVEEERIVVIAFGEQNPAVPNARPDGTPDAEGRAKNRRVEMTIAVPEGTPPAAPASDSGTLVDELTGAAED